MAKLYPTGAEHSYVRNKIGQILHDIVETPGSDIDGAVRRISTTYNNRGLEETITSWDNTTVGAATVVNEIKQVYDAFNQVTSDQQEHSGAVGGSTHAVSYAYTDGSSNSLRLTSTTTPSGHQNNVEYGTIGSIDEIFNRPASLQVQREAGNLVEFQYAGLSIVVDVFHPTPDPELSCVAKAGATGTGDENLFPQWR